MALTDLSKPFTTHCSTTIRTQVVEAIDKIVETEKKAQPEISNKITRSSVMSLLLANHLELMREMQLFIGGGISREQLEEAIQKMASQMENLDED